MIVYYCDIFPFHNSKYQRRIWIYKTSSGINYACYKGKGLRVIKNNDIELIELLQDDYNNDKVFIAGNERQKQLYKWLTTPEITNNNYIKQLSSSSSSSNVYLEITDNCNLSCPYCFIKSKGMELDVNLVLSILAAIKNIGWPSISLGGGEPTIHPDIETIVDGAIALGLDVCIKTNGTNPNDNIHKLSNRPIQWDISVHDNVRGEGTFKLIEDTLKQLKQKNVHVRRCLTTMSQQCIGHESKMIEWAYQNGFKEIDFTFPIVSNSSSCMQEHDQNKIGGSLIAIYENAKIFAPSGAKLNV